LCLLPSLLLGLARVLEPVVDSVALEARAWDFEGLFYFRKVMVAAAY
jgi:hypothetical protein